MSRPAALLPVLLVLGLAGCNALGVAGGAGPGVAGPAGAPPALPPEAAPSRVAVLLPLSGPTAALGASMLDAIRLAFGGDASRLDVHDTRGTEAGATEAAEAAVARQDAIVLGPLTATETRAAAAVAVPAGLPVLSYSSDSAVSQAGVWVLGLTPEQQVSRLVAAAKADGRTRLAAFLPQSPLGDAMAESFAAAAGADGLAAPDIRRHDADPASIADGLKSLSDVEARRAPIEDKLRADAASDDPAAKVEALQLAAAPTPPPPFDALLLADTGTGLAAILQALPADQIRPAEVRVMGPALWSRFARKLGRIAGAWYAAPDPASAAGFDRDFAARYGHPAVPLDEIAFDSAALAARLSRGEGFGLASLTRPDGFAGTDGVFALHPDGRVTRALAVFEIEAGGGTRVASPAPSLPGSGA